MITVAKKLPVDVTSKFVLKSAEVDTKSGAWVIINGTDPKSKLPVSVRTYVGNEVASDIFAQGILAQLEEYGEYPTLNEVMDAIRTHIGQEIKVRPYTSEYEGNDGAVHTSIKMDWDPED